MIWKSIETAPLGVAVLVYRPYAKMRGGKVELGLKQKYVGDDAPKWSVGGSRIKAEESLPTHWMPLPPSPHFALGVRLQNGRSVAQEAEWRLQRSFEDTARGVLYWTATLVALPPKDGNWSLFVAKDYDGAGFLAWSAEDGEWVEPDCRNTGYDDEYLRRSESVWTPAPNWMPIEPAW